MEKSRYTVGWIAALSIELTAAIQMLDEQHDPPADYLPRPTDSNVYVWGKVGDHNVVIAFLEAGAYGTVPAATTATNLFGSFPSIRMCLMVGIGAGIRRKGFDVRLGDVVISQPDGKSGGVYQYDLQKARSDGQLENIGVLNRPSTLLLKILARVQAHHGAHSSMVPEYTKRITREMAPPFNEPGYVHQGLKNDRLFKSTFSHVSEPSAVDDEDLDFDDSSIGEPSTTCPHCPPEEEIKRRERPSGTNPQFHYGTIASGNTLVKNSTTRNEIVKRVPGNCICFEMEAAGMMNNFPCLVIRGICDYADSHKNDRWQPYAALTAAAYAREFLHFAPKEDIEIAQPLVEQLEDIARTIHNIQNTTTETKATLRVGEVEKWLSPFDPSGNYNIAIDKRNEGLSESGRWFLESHKFLQWKNTKNSFLWLHGLAGCGKTILCSISIEHLKSEADRIVLYFYFAFNDQRTRSKGSLLRSLIMQLSRYDENAMKKAVEQKNKKNDQQPSDKELEKIFSSMAALFKQVTIVLDGIDELERKEDTRRDVLLWIKDIISIDAADVRILASSRNETDIKTELESLDLTFELTPETIDEDIKAFVHKQIQDESSRLRRWRNRQDVQALIEDTLIKKANGMFRWVACQIQAIQNCLNVKSLRQQLSSLPETLDETYDRIIQDLWETKQWDAIKLLQFLTFAETPLELLEAIDLIAVDVTETPSFDPDNRMPEPLEIVEVCSSLVVLDLHNARHGRLQLAHFSVKEYLVSGRICSDLLEQFTEISAHSSIVNICLGYLKSVLPSITSICMDVQDDVEISIQVQEKKTWEHDLSRFPLMDYAIHTWPRHARLCNQQKGTAMQIQMFFEQESSMIKWLVRYYPGWRSDVIKLKGCKVSCPVLLSIDLALEAMALKMIEEGFNLEAEVISEEILRPLKSDMAYGTSLKKRFMTSHLYLATKRCMRNVVEALIKRGEDIHKKGGQYGTALNVACFKPSKDITTTLLQRSRDCASQECHEKYVQGALKTIVIPLKPNLGAPPYYNPGDMVPARDQLVEYCLNLDNPGSLLDYCLKTVFLDRNLDLARRLLREGARVDAICRQNPQHIFGRGENFLLSFLDLFSGNEPDNVDPDALQKLFTAEDGSKEHTFMQQVIESGYNRVLSLMMARSPALEPYIPVASCSMGCVHWHGTALWKAVELGNTLAVQILLNINTRFPYKDGFEDYMPSLHYISERIGFDKDTCLHVAARWNEIEIMAALISCKAPLEAGNGRSQTPLHLACKYNRLEAVKLLVEHGANLQAIDCDGKTPMQLALQGTRGIKSDREPSTAVIEWLEQRNSQINSDDSLHPKRKREADNDDSSYTELDSKLQKTGQITPLPARP